MDELWQRYRTFWTPVLIGLGVFLVGLIAVHIMTPDPEQEVIRLNRKVSEVKRKVEPETRRIGMLDRNVETVGGVIGVEAGSGWSAKVDQLGGATRGEFIARVVEQALEAAYLRGADASGANNVSQLARTHFRGDVDEARRMAAAFNRDMEILTDGLRANDPDVGFSRASSQVWEALRRRAGRAGVRIKADQLGLDAVTSVTSASLPQRLLQLALIARVANVAIESGVDSITSVRLEREAPTSTTDFISEWYVTFDMTGDLYAVKRVIDHVTDPADPIPLGTTAMSLPKGSSPLSGEVRLDLKAYCTLVRPEAEINFNAEETE